MYVFTSDDFSGEIIECNEGDLEWIDNDEIFNLNLWEGDKIFLDKIKKDDTFFTMKFNYDGDTLLSYELIQY